MSAWFKANSTATYDTIIGNGNASVTTYEMLDVNNGYITFYSHSTSFKSTFAISTGRRYHVAMVQTSTGTSMYIDGVYNTGNSTRRVLT